MRIPTELIRWLVEHSPLPDDPLDAAPLKGDIPLSDGAAQPWLVLFPGGLLLAAATAGDGFSAPALEAKPLRYQPGVLSDKLTIGGYTLGVPQGSGDAVMGLLARARLGETTGAALPERSRFVEAMTPAERRWLGSALEHNERALAWLHTSTAAPIQEPVMDGDPTEWRYLLTDRRALLVAVSPVGDLRALPLDAAISLTARTGRRDRVSCGEVWWETTRSNGDDYEALVPATQTSGPGRVRAVVLAVEKDESLRAAVDLDYAVHLLAEGENREAQAVLEARLAALPDGDLEELLATEAALFKDTQRLRIRVHELLLEARGRTDGDDAETAVALARLQPLVPERIERAGAAARGEDGPAAASWAARCEAVARVLASGGLSLDDAASDDAPAIRSLATDAVDDTLQHPAARDDGALGKLQTLLASADVPDSSALASWCERLSPQELHARAALADACLALGVAGVDAFVSRGEKSVGLRAYEGDPPFLLLGGSHLEPDSPCFLHPDELRFVVGAEIAHLRFKHARVTAGEVWSGAWEKGMAGLDFMLVMLPAMKGWKLAEMVGRYAQGAVGGILEKAGITKEAFTKVGRKSAPDGAASAAAIAQRNDQLVAAHRVMQLTADRAGLVLCGQIQAAIRGMFLVYPSYQAELPLAERHGLTTSLSRRDPEDNPRFQDLSIRIAALLSFYLSDDYITLRRALLLPEA